MRNLNKQIHTVHILSGLDFGPALCSLTLSSVAAFAFESSLHIHHDHSLHSRHQHVPKPVVKKIDHRAQQHWDKE